MSTCKMKFAILITFTMLFLPRVNAFVGEQYLIKIISEPEDNLMHKMYLNLSETGELQQLIRRSVKDVDIFEIEEWRNSQVVLARASDRDAVSIGCQDCSLTEGGDVTLTYLYNGLLNVYKNFYMTIKPNAEGVWEIYTSPVKGPPVKIESLRLRSRKVGNILVGIRKIEVNK